MLACARWRAHASVRACVRMCVCVWVCECVCVCVCECVWVCECVLCVCLYAFSFLLVSILMSFLGEFSLILDGLELHFWFIWRSGGSQGLPWGALGSPWAPGWPQEGSNERKNGSLDPPWAPSLGSFFHHFLNFFRLKTLPQIYWFFDHFFNEFLVHFWLIFGWFLDDFPSVFFIQIWIRFLMDLGIHPGMPNLHFCNTFHAKSRFLKFDQVAKVRQTLHNFDWKILPKINKNQLKIGLKNR